MAFRRRMSTMVRDLSFVRMDCVFGSASRHMKIDLASFRYVARISKLGVINHWRSNWRQAPIGIL